jgi:hypothetical protein
MPLRKLNTWYQGCGSGFNEFVPDLDSEFISRTQIHVQGKEENEQKNVQVPAVLRIQIRDPVLFYPLDPGSGSGMNFFQIPDLGSWIQGVPYVFW